MPTSPHSGRRPASARRQLFAALTAAFLLFQQAIIFAPAASAQVRRATTLDKTTTPISSGIRKVPAPNVSVTTLGAPITQPFDALATTGTANAWTDDSTLAGWYSQFELQTSNPTTYRADSGGSNTGAIYSWGVAGTNDVSERAFGSIASGTPGTIYYALKLTNNTGATITSLNISFDGEQWRQGGNVNAQQLDFQYQVVNAGAITDANTPSTGWTDFDSLDFVSPVVATAAAPTTAATLDGNAAANRTAKAATLTVSVNNGQEIWLRFKDINDGGNDHGLAIDNFSVTPNGAAATPTPTPTPAGTTVSVNDVSQDEGNAGTTTFNFTVSLSTAQHGGVTMTFSTADGTATTADSDYQGFSTPVVFPNGSQSITIPVSVNGDSKVEPNETFFVNLTNISGATAADGQGQGTIQNDDVTIVPIHDIQGNNTESPRLGETLTTTGIVTLLRTGTNNGGAANSFFIQDPNVDADPNTSEGILVFTGSAPTVAVGDSVRVTGTVAEFFNMTEISPTTNVTVLSTGNSLPAPVTLTNVILDPTASPAQPQLEKYEGMRMTAGSLVTVAPSDTFYEVETVLGGVQRPLREPGIEISTPAVPPDPGEATPDCCIPRWDENPERIKVDTNGRAGSPLNGYTSNVTFTGLTGPLDFSFSEYKIIPEATPTASSNMSAVAAPAPEAGEFTVASYNIENFANNATQRQKAALTIRTLLHYPDVIGLVEIDDLSHLQALRDQINSDAVAAGDPNPAYEAYLSEGNVEGGGDSNQNVAFLVKTSRVFVTSVTQELKDETYTPPGGTTTFLHDRPPLVLDATVEPSGANPQHVIVVANHLRSFICIDADADPAVAAGCTNGAADGPRVREKRRKQAESVAGLLQELQTNHPGVPVMSVGDYNSYQFSDGFTDPIKTLKGLATVDNELAVDASPDLVNPDFVNVIDLLPAAERYSFVFEGTPQAIDHHLINAAARSRYTRAAVARVNADFPEVPAATYASNATRPERNSDHDPVVSYYRLGAAQAAGSLIISEFRFRGPGAPAAAPVGGGEEAGGPNVVTVQDQDEFIEFYNNTDSDITVATLDNSPGWALVASDGVTRFIIPNGTIIPARTHFLATGPGYSLNDYAQGDNVILPGDTGTPVNFYAQEIPDGSGIALFGTADPSNYTSANRLDAAGYATVAPLYREGTGFPAAGAEATSDLEYSFVRRVCVFAESGCGAGLPKDTSENASDFIVVNTDGAATTLGARLGAPGPEGQTSPVNGNAGMPGSLLDPSVSSSQEPNRVRDHTSNPAQQSPMGTLSIRRTITNNTGAPVVYLAFRIIEMTTFPSPGTAELRAIDSGDVTATVNGEPVDVRGTYVEQPPNQPNGGGMNTSLGVGYIDLEGNQLEDGDSVSVQFLLGVVHTGTFRFYVNIELINGEAPVEGAPAAPLGAAPDSRKMRKYIQEQRVRQRARRAVR